MDTFTKLTRSPSSVLLIPNGNGIYSINKDNFEIPEPPKPKLGERESGNILMQLGHVFAHLMILINILVS